MRPGPTWGMALTVVAALTLAACGSNRYTYVNNASEETFFKVPSEWKVFRVKPDEDTTDRPTADQQQQAPWHVVFDSAGDANADHADEEHPADVVGQALIFDITATQGDQLSSKDLRTAFLGSDPLDDQSTDVEVLKIEPLQTKDGLHGSHIRFNRRLSDGSWVTTDHQSLINAGGTKVYVFELKGDSAKFKADADQISQIVDSFQVRK